VEFLPIMYSSLAGLRYLRRAAGYLHGVGGLGVGFVGELGDELDWLLKLPEPAIYSWVLRGAALGLRAGRRYMKMRIDAMRRLGGYASRACYSPQDLFLNACGDIGVASYCIKYGILGKYLLQNMLQSVNRVLGKTEAEQTTKSIQ
jgi:hypothetical protein